MRSTPMLDFPLSEFEQRQEKLFAKLEDGGFAAALLTNEENLRYYCNFRSSAWNSEFLCPAMLIAVRGGRLALIGEYGLLGAGIWNLMRPFVQGWTVLDGLYEVADAQA